MASECSMKSAIYGEAKRGLTGGKGESRTAIMPNRQNCQNRQSILGDSKGRYVISLLQLGTAITASILPEIQNGS